MSKTHLPPLQAFILTLATMLAGQAVAIWPAWSTQVQLVLQIITGVTPLVFMFVNSIHAHAAISNPPAPPAPVVSKPVALPVIQPAPVDPAVKAAV